MRMRKNSNILTGFLLALVLLLLAPAIWGSASVETEKYSLSDLTVTSPSHPDLSVKVSFNFSHQKALSKDNQGPLLEKGQLRVFEDGKSRNIRKLEKTDTMGKGKSVVIAIDHSVSMVGSKLGSAKNSLISFINKSKDLPPLAVVGFNKSNQKLISKFGSDKQKLKENVSELSAYGKTPLYDTVFYATEILEKREGANYLIIITDGNDTSSGKTLEETLQRADDYNLTVHTFTPEKIRREEVREDLNKLSTGTGGKLIDGFTSNKLIGIVKGLKNQVKERYTLTYSAIENDNNCERRVKLRIEKAEEKLTQTTVYQFPDIQSPVIEYNKEDIPEATASSSIEVPLHFEDNCSLGKVIIQDKTYNLDVNNEKGAAAETIEATLKLEKGKNADIKVLAIDKAGNRESVKIPSIFYDSEPPELIDQYLNIETPPIDEPNKLYSNVKNVTLELISGDNYQLDHLTVVLPDGKEKEFDLEGKKDKATVELDLEEQSTQIELILEDQAGHEYPSPLTVILDQKAPDLDVNINTKTKLETCNGKPITNKDQVPLRILARDSNFDHVELGDDKLDCSKENGYYICNTNADLNSGKNKKSVTAVDKAGNESKENQSLILDKQNPSLELAGEFSRSTAKSKIVIPLKFTDDWCLNQVVIKNDELGLHEEVNLQGEEYGIESKLSLEKLEKQLTQTEGVNEIETEIRFELEDKAGNIEPMDQKVTFAPGIINKSTDETYSDIHEAVNSANPGNTIQIGEMDVTGNIEIKKELTLTGLGPDKTTLESAKMGVPVLEIKGVPSGVTIKNMHVKSKRSECFNSQKDICPYAISVKGKSKVNVTNSVLSNSSMAAVKVSGESQVEVSSSELTVSKYGLVAAESSKTSLTDTKINNNTSHGLVIQNNSIAKINDCAISDNSGAGIRIESLEEQTVRGSNIKENGYGVIIPSNGDLLLKENEICTNDQHDLAAFSKVCGFDQEAEEFSGEIKNQNNSICSVCPHNLLEE